MLTQTLYFTSILTLISGTEDFRSNLNLTGLDYYAWWGSSEDKKEVTTIRRIKLQFRDEMIEDLQFRLKHRRPITPSLEGTWFEYGINSQVADDWLNYWEHEYPFKDREQVLNQFPHYMTNIQGLDIHFVRVRPKVPKQVEVVPLLLTNGWPSSFIAFYEVIPRLVAWSKGRDFAVEVIYPTIPGFTLSEIISQLDYKRGLSTISMLDSTSSSFNSMAAVRPGLGPPEIGFIFRKLMHRLGHKKYYMAAGDLGYIICNFMATAFPEDVLGFFTQIVMLQSFTSRIPSLTSLVPPFENSIYVGNFSNGRVLEDYIQQMAYLYHQSTKPDTLGNAMNESPSGLLSYLLQAFHFGRVLDRRENAGVKIQDHIPRDVLLDNIMLFWITGSIGTSMRMYAETFNRRILALNIDETPTPVLTWITEPKYEIIVHPYWVLKTKYPNLISYKTLDFGGHFFPYEFPEFHAKEILTAINAFRKTCMNSTEIKIPLSPGKVDPLLDT